MQKDIFRILNLRSGIPGSNLSFEHEFYPIKYKVPEPALLKNLEATSFSEPCFKVLNFYEFYFLLVSILEEKKIAFFS